MLFIGSVLFRKMLKIVRPDFYDDDGIRNSRHVYKDKQPGTALGDNPIIGENDEDDESVDSIFESITDKYKNSWRVYNE